jgi:2-polyprenyl-6-hydroxyphenyl methylase/3-demethylubiquinone-9 3-methyltransferase
LFGPFEHAVAEAYRRIFVDLDEFVGLMSAWIPEASRILEVGCGEGAVTERLVLAYPTSIVTAIDISPKAGRLFLGEPSRVTFRQQTAEEVARREPGSFDLVILADVIHHVPPSARHSLLDAIKQAMKPNGCLVFKEWLVSHTPMHWLCAASDRYVSGEEVSYCTMDGAKLLLTETFGADSIRRLTTLRKGRNNVVLLIQQ